MSEARPKLDFIGVGVSKCGTTWIHRCLSEHPEICMAENPKETRFFSSRNYVLGFTWYKKHFSHCYDENMVGEFSPNYIEEPEAISRIIEQYPNIKYIVALRRPIDQMRSRWQFGYRRGAHTFLSFNDYVNKTFAALTSKVRYGTNLSYLLERIDKEDLYVIMYDDWVSKPDEEILKLYQFLGVTKNFQPPSLMRRINESSELHFRFPMLNRSIFRLRRSSKRSPSLRKLIILFKQIGVIRIFAYVQRLNRTKKSQHIAFDDTLDAQNRERLLEIFKNEMAILSKELHVSIPENWMTID